MSRITELTGRADHRVAIVLGSGLSDVAARLVGSDPIPYSDLGLPRSTVPGHEGALYHGEVEGIPCLVFAGRVHLYEGHDAREVTEALSQAIAVGCDIVILTNAVGGISRAVEPGGLCLVADHINLSGANPLRGPWDEGGPDFLDLTDLYDPDLRALARRSDPDLPETVFVQLPGPSYETPAEIRMLEKLGAETVGMSTAIEAIAARHLGARVLAISVVTNQAAGSTGEPLDHREVAAAGRAASSRLEELLRGVISGLQ